MDDPLPLALEGPGPGEHLEGGLGAQARHPLRDVDHGWNRLMLPRAGATPQAILRPRQGWSPSSRQATMTRRTGPPAVEERRGPSPSCSGRTPGVPAGQLWQKRTPWTAGDAAGEVPPLDASPLAGF